MLSVCIAKALQFFNKKLKVKTWVRALALLFCLPAGNAFGMVLPEAGIAKAPQFLKKLRVKSKKTVTLGLHPQGVLAKPEIRKKGGDFLPKFFNNF